VKPLLIAAEHSHTNHRKHEMKKPQNLSKSTKRMMALSPKAFRNPLKRLMLDAEYAASQAAKVKPKDEKE